MMNTVMITPEYYAELKAEFDNPADGLIFDTELVSYDEQLFDYVSGVLETHDWSVMPEGNLLSLFNKR